MLHNTLHIQSNNYNASTNTPALATTTGYNDNIFQVTTQGIQAINGVSSFCGVGDEIIVSNAVSQFYVVLPVQYNAATGAVGALAVTITQLQQVGRIITISVAGTQTINGVSVAMVVGQAWEYNGSSWLNITNPFATQAQVNAGVVNNLPLAPSTFAASSQLAALAPLASPALTGTPTAPTAAVGTNTTQLATTAFVKNQGFQPNLGFTPVQQGGGTGQQANKLYMGWGTNSRIKVQVDTTDQGNLVTDSYLNNGTLPASFKGALSLVGSGSMYVAGAGDVNGYGFVATTPNGVSAPNGNSQLGALTMHQRSVANLGISYPNIPNCANSFTMGFGWDGSHVRCMVDNNTGVVPVLANLSDVTSTTGSLLGSIGINAGAYSYTVAGWSSNSTRTVSMTVTINPIGGAFNFTLSVNPQTLASQLGIAIPNGAWMTVNPGTFARQYSNGANAIHNMQCSTPALTNILWQMNFLNTTNDSAQGQGFQFAAMWTF